MFSAAASQSLADFAEIHPIGNWQLDAVPYMIGHVANELRHHKFRKERMVSTIRLHAQVFPGAGI